MKEIICITCPKGCHLKVDEETFAVTGNACPRGAVYGANELRNPVRVVTSDSLVRLGALRAGVLRTSSAEFKGEVDLILERIAETIRRSNQ